MILLSQALKGAKSVKEIDVSLNEIGPSGFQALCVVLPETNIQTLICSKNFLGDEILGYFSQIISGESGCGTTKLKKFDFSSCRLNDLGLTFLISALQHNKLVNSIKLADNFFSEGVETLILETLNKNTSLVDIGL